MIIVDLVCPQGHRAETALPSMFSPNPGCATCTAPTWRRPPGLRVTRPADPGPSREQMPRTWRATGGGDAETVRHWHDVARRREALEEKHPELAGDRRPVLAHEGLFAGAPLRAGDDVAASVAARIVSRDAATRAPGEAS